MHTLNFNSNKSLKSLARETLKAETFKQPYTNKTTKEKGVYLVKDEGIYLMNAYELEKGKTASSEGLTVYASGFNPKYDKYGDLWDRTYEISADDFAEFVPMDEDQLKRVAEGGIIKIDLSPSTLTVWA
tara:strand:+ start:112 stop:498 length:387 start_codon:yes stop_codon:yes gene_type:complete